MAAAASIGAARNRRPAMLTIDRAAGGAIRFDGQRIQLQSAVDAIRAGIALVPEDRKEQGVILEMAVRENISLAGECQHAKAWVFRDRAHEDKVSRAMIDQLRIKTPNDRQFVQFLSGGNQQKVALGKWLPLKPRLLLLDEPTRGIDVGAKQEIYRLMEELAESGVAIVFVSSEMPEILGMSDRALVMHQGRITGALAREELTEEAVMRLATGSPKNDE
jgi:ribose transport system ATP-binding protein